MADETLKRDENRVTVLGGITDDANQEVRMLRVNPTSKRLMVSVDGTSLPIFIGQTITGGTVGSVLFIGAGGLLAQDNANFFYNDTLNRLGIQTNSPTTTLTIAGTGANGLDIAVDASSTSLSQRLFMSNGTGGQSVALFNFGGGLSIRTGATPGAGSGTERYLMSSLGTIVSTSSMAISSGIGAFIDFNATITNTGTAAYRGIRFTATETSVGSGTDLLLHLLTGSTTRFSVQSNGAVVAASGMTIAAGSSYIFTNRSRMTSPSDGTIVMANNASTDFLMLEFGGTTSAFPAIKRVSAGIQLRVADDSAYAAVDALSYAVGGVAGASGTFTTTDLKTVTVTNGIITSIV
jgi:hypothetical protein